LVPFDIAGLVQVASANNLIGHSGTAGGLVNGANGNIVGVDQCSTDTGKSRPARARSRAVSLVLFVRIEPQWGKNWGVEDSAPATH
jgi:hypothetical protein